LEIAAGQASFPGVEQAVVVGVVVNETADRAEKGPLLEFFEPGAGLEQGWSGAEPGAVKERTNFHFLSFS
jgi:hypothetical protein